MGCELRAGQGSLQCTESRTTRSGPWAALDPQRPSAATAFTNLCAPGKPPSREMGASLHFWPGHLRGPPRSLPSLTLLAGVGGREATSQLPPPQNKLTSPAGSLLMGPHSGGRKMEWTLSPEPGVPAPSCPGIGAPVEPRVDTDCDAAFRKERLLSSCQETL